MNEYIECQELEQMRHQYNLLKEQIGTVPHMKAQFLRKAIDSDMSKRAKNLKWIIIISVILMIPKLVDIILDGSDPKSMTGLVLLGLCIMVFARDLFKVKHLSKFADENVADAQTKLMAFYETRSRFSWTKMAWASVVVFVGAGFLAKITRYGFHDLFTFDSDFIQDWTILFVFIMAMAISGRYREARKCQRIYNKMKGEMD